MVRRTSRVVDPRRHAHGLRHAKVAPSRSISAAELGEAGGDHGGVVDRDRAGRRRGPASGRPWRCGGRDGWRPCRRRARPCRRRRSSVSPSTLAAHAVGGEPGRRRRQPVALLHLELGQPLHARLALGVGGKTGEHRIFVDHARRALGRHAHALERGVAHADVGHRLAALLALVGEGRRRRPSRAASRRSRCASG